MGQRRDKEKTHFPSWFQQMGIELILHQTQDISLSPVSLSVALTGAFVKVYQRILSHTAQRSIFGLIFWCWGWHPDTPGKGMRISAEMIT